MCIRHILFNYGWISIISTSISTTISTPISAQISTRISTLISTHIPTHSSTLISAPISTHISTIISAPISIHISTPISANQFTESSNFRILLLMVLLFNLNIYSNSILFPLSHHNDTSEYNSSIYTHDLTKIITVVTLVSELSPWQELCCIMFSKNQQIK